MNENNVFDAITLAIWIFIERVAVALWKLLAVAAKAAHAILRRLLDFVPERRRGAVWEIFDRILEIPGSVADSGLAEDGADLAVSALERFSNFMRISSKPRLAVLAAAAVALAFYMHPPSHWGPWHPFQVGRASYYSSEFAGKKTAIGERFDPGAMTAAHKSLPLGAVVKVENLSNGRTVYVRINDRGPYAKGRIIDLSQAAAKRLGFVKEGTARVRIYIR